MKPRGPDAVAAQDPNRIVAIIDGKKISARQAADMLKAFPPDQRKQIDANLAKVVEQIYMHQQIAETARKLNLDQQTPWKEQLELSRDNVLFQAYMAHLNDAAGKAGTEDPQKYYDTHAADFDMLSLRGIFIAFAGPGTPAGAAAPGGGRTEQQARDKADDLEKKLKTGADFAALSRSDSDNPAVAAKGGELGSYSITDPQIPADIKNAVTKLQPGQFSEPIRIQSAFLIVKVDSRQKVPFETAKAGIAQKLQNEKAQAAAKQETDKYKLQVQDADFFNAAPAAAAIPSLQRPGDAPAPPAAPGKPKS